MLLPLFAMLLQAAPVATPTPCTAVAAPPAGLSAWTGPDAAAPAIGQPAALTLQPVATAKFVAAPGRPPAPGSFGGSFALTIATPGTYRVALSAGAWIDVIDASGKSLSSVAHTEGPACSGIRKIVDFTLAQGAYSLQLSGAKTASVRVLVVAKP